MFTACLWIYRLKGLRWLAASLLLLQGALVIGASFIAGMSVTGDWLYGDGLDPSIRVFPVAEGMQYYFASKDVVAQAVVPPAHAPLAFARFQPG